MMIESRSEGRVCFDLVSRLFKSYVTRLKVTHALIPQGACPEFVCRFLAIKAPDVWSGVIDSPDVPAIRVNSIRQSSHRVAMADLIISYWPPDCSIISGALILIKSPVPGTPGPPGLVKREPNRFSESARNLIIDNDPIPTDGLA
jgi:hypothetical protein